MSLATQRAGHQLPPNSGMEFGLPGLMNAFWRLQTSNFLAGSYGENFQCIGFGRDQAEMLFSLCQHLPAVADDIILFLAQTMSSSRREAADITGPGQIAHEVHLLRNGPRVLNRELIDRMNALGDSGGGKLIEQPLDRNLRLLGMFPRYSQVILGGSADVTPKFVRAVELALNSPQSRLTLESPVNLLDGKILPLWLIVYQAVSWTQRQIQESERFGSVPLLGFQRSKLASGPAWQNPTDGGASLTFADGHLANRQGRVETIDLQADAFDCLMAGSRLLEDRYPVEAASWHKLALQLQEATLATFWLESEQYFGMFRDRDPVTGQPRVADTLSWLPATLLRSGIFNHVSALERQKYIGGIVRMLYSREFHTAAGIRSLAIRHANLPHPNYWGVRQAWPIAQAILVEGLYACGLDWLARDGECRTYNALHIAGDGYEFLLVDLEGRVRYRLAPWQPGVAEADSMVATNLPDFGHGWTVAFLLKVALDQLKLDVHPKVHLSPAFQKALTAEVYNAIGLEYRLLSPQEAQMHRQEQPITYVNTSKGLAIDSMVEQTGYGQPLGPQLTAR